MTDAPHKFLGDLDALRLAFKQQIEASRLATERRGGKPARRQVRNLERFDHADFYNGSEDFGL